MAAEPLWSVRAFATPSGTTAIPSSGVHISHSFCVPPARALVYSPPMYVAIAQ